MPSLSAVEIMVVLGLALIVLGPQKLPSTARQIGKVLGDLRRMASGFQDELRTAFDDGSDPPYVPTPLAPPPKQASSPPPLSPPGTAAQAPPSASTGGGRPLSPPDTARS